MKNLFLFLVFLSTNMLRGQNGIKIKFYNKTGHDISDFSFMDIKVPLIKSNDSTAVFLLDSMPVNDNVPHAFPNGTIKNFKLKPNSKYHTEKETPFVKVGVFYCSIRLSEYSNNSGQLWLARKRD